MSERIWNFGGARGGNSFRISQEMEELVEHLRKVVREPRWTFDPLNDYLKRFECEAEEAEYGQA